MRCTGVTVRGIITPVFQQGDNLVKAICKSITDAAKYEKFELSDGDIVSVTEAVVARIKMKLLYSMILLKLKMILFICVCLLEYHLM